MEHITTNSVTNRAAQLAYLAEDKELVELIWKISALPDDARLIVSLMVAHLSELQRARAAA